VTQLSAEALEDVLAGTRSMLRADGYDLAVEVDDGRIVLAVRATESACEECLVPKDLFASIAAKSLADGGIDVEADQLTVRYPNEEHR
jgi:hypothetical protein